MAENPNLSPDYLPCFRPIESCTSPTSLELETVIHDVKNVEGKLECTENEIRKFRNDVFEAEGKCIPLRSQIAAQEMIRIKLESEVATFQKQLTSRKVALDAFRDVVKKEREQLINQCDELMTCLKKHNSKESREWCSPEKFLNSRAKVRELSHRCALNTDGTQKLIKHIAEMRQTTQESKRGRVEHVRSRGAVVAEQVTPNMRNLLALYSEPLRTTSRSTEE